MSDSIRVGLNQTHGFECQPEEDGRHGGEGPIASWGAFHGFPMADPMRSSDALYSGAPLPCIRARTKNSERPRCKRCAPETQTSSLQLTWLDEVLMCRTLPWSSTTKWPTRLRLMCIVLVGFIGAAFPTRYPALTWLTGRTGRAGKMGTAITFLTNDDDEVMCVFFCDFLWVAQCGETD